MMTATKVTVKALKMLAKTNINSKVMNLLDAGPLITERGKSTKSVSFKY